MSRIAKPMIAIDSYRVTGPAKGLLDFCASARDQIDPIVVTFRRSQRAGAEFQQECERRGIPVEVVWERYRYDVSLVSRTLRVAQTHRPDLIQTHGYKADLLGLAVRWRLGVPWIAFSHGPTAEGPKMRFYLALDEGIIRRADRVIAVSKARRDALAARGCSPDRLVTIYNAVEVPPAGSADGAEVRRELELHGNGPVLAVVGRLSPEKGQRYFVDAMGEIVRVIPGAVGLVVGDGPDEERLRGQVATLGLGEVIRFIGYRRDMHRIYAAIDLLLVPSLNEGLPNVVLEAMAQGRPVVATRVGGVPEVIDDGVSGVLVAPGDARALARATVELLGDPARCASVAMAARQRVERHFSIQTRTAHILSVYRDVLRTSRTRPREALLEHEATMDR